MLCVVCKITHTNWPWSLWIASFSLKPLPLLTRNVGKWFCVFILRLLYFLPFWIRKMKKTTIKRPQNKEIVVFSPSNKSIQKLHLSFIGDGGAQFLLVSPVYVGRVFTSNYISKPEVVLPRKTRPCKWGHWWSRCLNWVMVMGGQGVGCVWPEEAGLTSLTFSRRTHEQDLQIQGQVILHADGLCKVSPGSRTSLLQQVKQHWDFSFE